MKVLENMATRRVGPEQKADADASKKNGAEKPASLYGPKFEDVLEALLKTKPMPKRKKKKKGK